METYKITRLYQNNRKPRTIRAGLTLKQAQEHCQDPETSSMTSSKCCENDPVKIEKWHEKNMHWFDSYTNQ